MSEAKLELVAPPTDDEKLAAKKERKRIYNAEHYAANKEHYAEANKQWQDAHPERVKELAASYRKRHKKRLSVKREAWKLAHPEYDKQSSAKYNLTHPDRRAAARRLRQYDLTPEGFELLLEVQDGRCAICRLSFTDENKKTKPNVDHDHATGRIRGLLCHRCNIGIGHFSDNPDLMAAALAYLRPKETK